MTVVLHVLEALEGGTAHHVTDLVRHVTGVTHHVAVPAIRVGGVTDALAAPQMEAAGAVVHRVDMRRMPASPRNIVALERLRELIGRVGADVVHGHSAVGGALARLAAEGRGVRRIYTPNGLHPSPVAMVLERALGPLTDRMIAVSPSEARVIAARGLVPGERVAIVPNGIDPEPVAVSSAVEPIDLRNLLALGPDTPLVGFVGRLVPQKAPEVVVEAAVRVNAERDDVRVVIIGSGRREGEIDELVRRRGLGQVVRLVPYLPRAAEVMDQLDAFLLPSRYEGCPYTVLEAMRAGTPVVVSDAVGNRDLVVDGTTGRMVRSGDAAAAARAVLDVLSDTDAAGRMARAAREYVARHHDVRHTTAAVAELYEG